MHHILPHASHTQACMTLCLPPARVAHCTLTRLLHHSTQPLSRLSQSSRINNSLTHVRTHMAVAIQCHHGGCFLPRPSHFQFAAMMMASGADGDGSFDDDGDDGVHGDVSPTWDVDTPSPLDRYPSGAPIFDFAEDVEARVMRGPRSNRPRRGQGDRAGVARADIPRTSKSSRSGGKVRARVLEQMKERMDKYAARAPPRGGYWRADGDAVLRGEFVPRPAGVARSAPVVTQWRIGRNVARQRAAMRESRQPHFPGHLFFADAAPVCAGTTHHIPSRRWPRHATPMMARTTITVCSPFLHRHGESTCTATKHP
jgi:hypothetical protein